MRTTAAQDGEPAGTGSDGPGHAIHCEYHQLRDESDVFLVEFLP